MDVTFVSPNTKMKNILSLEDNFNPHDVHLSDLDQRAGILMKGAAPAVNEIIDLIRERIPCTVTFKHPIQQDSVYLTTVLKYISRKRFAVIDLDGRSRGIVFNIKCQVGDNLLVQVKELTKEIDKLPVCSTAVSLTGNFVILEEGVSFVRVSRKIKGEDRKRLHQLGKKLVPENFGIIIRTSALEIQEDELAAEISQLTKLWERVTEDAIETSNPKRLISGDFLVEILFTHESKSILDTLRNGVIPTLRNYHQFKAYSMASGFTLDFIQNFLDRLEPEEINHHMSAMIIERDYPVNNHLKVEFKFLDGTREELVVGDLIANQELFITRRVFDYKPKLSFPNFEVSQGDIFEVYLSPGSWTIYYKYINGSTDELIGERVQIVLPLDYAFRGRIRAIDMGMNLYKNSASNSPVVHQIIDRSRSDLVERGIISAELDQDLGSVLQQIITALDADVSPIHVLNPAT
ncbi:MAG: ribonuclease E/G [Candidatus Heimdallarchaeota archaeon]|nr:ribonuclease E/G [Candidatus Heimdallarchaeota archaeon]